LAPTFEKFVRVRPSYFLTRKSVKESMLWSQFSAKKVGQCYDPNLTKILNNKHRILSQNCLAKIFFINKS
jgi:hypothetical protein